jgi:hypothetical protein
MLVQLGWPYLIKGLGGGQQCISLLVLHVCGLGFGWVDCKGKGLLQPRIHLCFCTCAMSCGLPNELNVLLGCHCVVPFLDALPPWWGGMRYTVELLPLPVRVLEEQ